MATLFSCKIICGGNSNLKMNNVTATVILLKVSCCGDGRARAKWFVDIIITSQCTAASDDNLKVDTDV